MKKLNVLYKQAAEHIRWLFTKDGQPVLASIIVGAVVGFFISGPLGLLLATLAGFVVLQLFHRLPFKLNPWQALVVGLTPVIAKLFFSLAFQLPISNYLSLPSGDMPDTLPKYLSGVVSTPDNLISRPASNVPGFVLIVLVAIGLMYLGSLNLNKMRNWLLALAGLLLYTLSPTITSIIEGSARVSITSSYFSVGYYFAWLGLLLFLVSRALPGVLKVSPAPAGKLPGALNLLPPFIALGFLSQLNAPDTSHFQLLQLFDTNMGPDYLAAFFSAILAAISAGVIVYQAQKSQ